MVTISKELFVKSIKQIQQGIQERNKFDEAMSKINSSYFVSTIGNDWLYTAIELLCNSVGDKSDEFGTVIEWFLFEGAKKEIIIDQNTVIDVSTPEKLYDYFVLYGG